MVKRAGEFLLTVVGTAAILWIIFVVAERYKIEPDNAEIILDLEKGVYASPPCALAGIVERPLITRDDGRDAYLIDEAELSTMAELRARRETSGPITRPACPIAT